MSEKTSLTIAGDWGKPAQALIEKVSDAIGGGLKPWQIRRIAKAEADALVTRTRADIKASDLLRAAGLVQSEVGERAVQRMIAKEVRKQVNIENVTRIALESLSEDATPEKIDDDFVSALLEGASETSDEEMQSLWASILSGEANQPGTFSKRTIDCVRQFDKSDALLFTEFASTVWMLNEPFSFAFEEVRKVLDKRGVNFAAITHLESIGLLRFNPVAGFKWTLETSNEEATVLLHYFGQPLVVKLTNKRPEIEMGAVLLTETGKQLARICGAKPDLEIRDAAISRLVAAGHTLFSPIREILGKA